MRSQLPRVRKQNREVGGLHDSPCNEGSHHLERLSFTSLFFEFPFRIPVLNPFFTTSQGASKCGQTTKLEIPSLAPKAIPP